MRTSMTIVAAIVLSGVLATGSAQTIKDRPSESADLQYTNVAPERTWRETWDSAPVPAETSYSGNAKKHKQFEQGFRHGYTWAFGDTPFCPTNPSDSNQPVAHGWIEGWKAGVQAGGTNSLPSKYSAYIAWHAPRQ